jgi:hypothetical protein
MYYANLRFLWISYVNILAFKSNYFIYAQGFPSLPQLLFSTSYITIVTFSGLQSIALQIAFVTSAINFSFCALVLPAHMLI